METFPWRPFLERYSRELLADRRIRREAPEEVLHSCWMGFSPATTQEIVDLEARLGTRLPESYRQFLATTNGWRNSGAFIYEVWPTTKIDWFRNTNRDWINAYLEPARNQPDLSEADHCVYGEQQDPCRFRLGYPNWIVRQAKSMRERGDPPQLRSTRFFPEENGLVPFAENWSGDLLFFSSDDPDGHILTCPTGDPNELISYSYGFAQFLITLFSGKLSP